MSLVIVGSVALDTVETVHGKVRDALGGSAMYASAVASHFTSPRIVGVVGEDFPTKYEDLLRERGVDVSGLERVPGQTFRWVGRYTDLNRAETLDTKLNVFADFDPKLPESYRDAPYLFLGNIDPTLQLNVLDQMRGPKVTACDTMNFWISGTRSQLEKVISRVDILFINEDEIKQLTGIENIFKAAAETRKMGVKWIIVKRGEYGAVGIGEDFLFFTPVYPIDRVVDPTGAGDSFAGGFMGYLASQDQLTPDVFKRGMIYGTITASFDIEDFSLDALLRLNRQSIDQRMERLLQIMRID